MKLSNFTALTFDCYGTLIDWETGITAALAPLTDQVEGLTSDDILQAHAHHESAAQAWSPAKRYSDLLAIVYKRLAEEWEVAVTWDECVAYGQSVGEWPAFPDSHDALTYLKGHYQIYVLTNTDNASFAGSNALLGVDFDGIYTAEDIGSYKPNGRNFDYMFEMLDRQGIAKAQILHTAESMFHDHGPANKHGLANCYIHRRHSKEGFGATMDPGDLPTYDFRFTSMAELVLAHQAEREAG